MKNSLHFPDSSHALALEAFHSETAPCRLVLSHHWASEGYWLEYPPYTQLASGLDCVLGEKSENNALPFPTERAESGA